MLRPPLRSTRTDTLLSYPPLCRSATDPARARTPPRCAAVDGGRLHDDVEGRAILPRGRAGGLLFAASQDDDSFAVFRLPDGAYAGGFRIRGGAIDGTEDTDGIALQDRKSTRLNSSH